MDFKRIPAALLALIMVALLLSADSGKDKWITWTSKRGGFKIDFPSKPELSDSQLENGKSYKAQARKGNTVYFAVYSVFEGEANFDPYEAARVSIDQFALSTTATVQERDDWKVKGNRGQEGRMYSEGSQTDFWYRAIFIKDKLYQIGVAEKGKISDENAAKSFFKTFKLL